MYDKTKLPEGVKDKAKYLSGIHAGIEWSITSYLCDDGNYYSVVLVGGMEFTTEKADDLDTALGYGAACVVEGLEVKGVRYGA